jgi:ECF transporter S component (folate family)
MSFFVSLYAVFSWFAIYITNDLRFNLTFMPAAWAAVIFGPVAGGVTGAFGDVLGWIIRPNGPFFPGFTISGFVTGVIFGLFFYRQEITLKRAILAAISVVLIVELGLNTIWIMILFGNAFKVLIVGRLIKALIILPVQVLVLYGTGYFLKRMPSLLHFRRF